MGVGVAGERIVQPVALGNSSVSQIIRMYREKREGRDLDTVVDTSNKGDTLFRL